MDFNIDVSKSFRRLPRAPIVEAVIQWQATPTKAADQTQLQDELTARFQGFDVRPQHRVEAEIQLSADGTRTHQQRNWDGFRLTSSDQKFVCQFKRNTVAFSRLAPYEGWEPFEAAARPFWQEFQVLAAPVTVDRIGVRFISQVKLKNGEIVSDYVEPAPEPLAEIGLDSESFFYQNSILIPGRQYRLNLIRTVKSNEPPLNERSLIVDIDVATTDETALKDVEHRLQEMRYIKNEVFFSYMKDAESKFG